jgi:hypothetical protein
MGYSASASESLDSNNLSLSSPNSSPEQAYPLMRTNKFKYLPDIVHLSPMDCLTYDASFLSDLMAWDKNVEEQQDFLALHASPCLAHLTSIPFRYKQQLATIMEVEEVEELISS